MRKRWWVDAVMRGGMLGTLVGRWVPMRDKGWRWSEDGRGGEREAVWVERGK